MTDSDSAPDTQFIRQLKLAIADLLWLSEAESPFSIIYWNNSTGERKTILQHRYPSQTKIVMREFSFFASATQEQPWHNQEEQKEVERYRALVNLLTKNLSDLQVYLVGEVEIDVYILGKTEDKAIAGLLTKIVAT